MKKTSTVVLLVVSAGVLTGLYTNCSQSASFSIPSQNLSAAPSGNGILCSPFLGGTGPASSGVLASITYIDPKSPVIGRGVNVESFAAGEPDVQIVPQQVLLSQFYVPTQAFTDGFALADGTDVLDSNGRKLVQYFALHSVGDIALTSDSSGTSSPGYYQFATLSDDGSIFTATDPSGAATLVNDDGTHSNRFACSNQAASLQPGAPLSFKMDYYQGPPVSIGLVLMWRKVDPSQPDSLKDDLCNFTGSDSYYFTPDKNGMPQPTANYLEILSHGWSVVPSANFVLPAGVTNNCG